MPILDVRNQRRASPSPGEPSDGGHVFTVHEMFEKPTDVDRSIFDHNNSS